MQTSLGFQKDPFTVRDSAAKLGQIKLAVEHAPYAEPYSEMWHAKQLCMSCLHTGMSGWFASNFLQCSDACHQAGSEESTSPAGFPVDGWTNFKTLKKHELVVAEGTV